MKKRIIYSSFIGFLIVGIALLIFIYYPSNLQAEAPSGLPANLATSSSRQVGTSTTVTILDQNANSCTSRTVSTSNQPIRLSFGFALDQNNIYGSTTLTQDVGIFQGASSTVSYDSGLYGCGTTSAIAIANDNTRATSTVTINSYR